MKVANIDVDLATREIHADGAIVQVGSRAFDILALLLAARGQIVSSGEILKKVWPDTVVDESNIRVQVCALRKALGVDGRLVQNIPGRGYRLAQKTYNSARLDIDLFKQETFAPGLSQIQEMMRSESLSVRRNDSWDDVTQP